MLSFGKTVPPVLTVGRQLRQHWSSLLIKLIKSSIEVTTSSYSSIINNNADLYYIDYIHSKKMTVIRLFIQDKLILFLVA